MASRPPPIPPAGRTKKRPTETPAAEDAAANAGNKPPENLAEQGQQGNIKQNTRNQGYQQDR